MSFVNSYESIKKADQIGQSAELQRAIEGRRRIFFPITIDLSTARDQYNALEIAFSFQALWVVTATDASTLVKLVPNSKAEGQLNQPMDIGQNLFMRLPFQASGGQLFWSAQAGKSITIYFYVDAQVAPGSLISQLSGGVSITEGSSLSSAKLASTGDQASKSVTSASAVVLLPADSSRKTITLYTDQAIWIGDASVAVGTRGILIPAGVFEWKATSILYAIAVGATATVTGNDTR